MTRKELLGMIGALVVAPIALTRLRESDESAGYVSLIRVIANPQSFDGKRLRLVGYLHHAGLDRGVGLYVDEISGKNGIGANAIPLNSDEASVRKYISKYVILEGVFRAPSGALASFRNGILDHVDIQNTWGAGDST